MTMIDSTPSDHGAVRGGVRGGEIRRAFIRRHALAHVPAKWIRFAGKHMRQSMDLARFLIARMIPCERKAR
jgi:hypothetical protein